MSDPESPPPVSVPARWEPRHTAALIACAALIAAGGYGAVPRSHLGAWAGVMGLLVIMSVIVGLATTGRAAGALIDHRNRYSLSRLQLLLWTILVGSSFYVAGMANVLDGGPDPLQVDVPPSLWALLGFGVTSAVGAPVIRQTKARRPANLAQRDQTFRALAARSGRPGGAESFANVGQLVVNRSVTGAASSDLLTGDEVGDAAYVNLGKLQFAFTTLLGILLYAAALAETLQHPAPIHALPALDNGLVTLLGISHAGFLAHGAVPQSLDAA